MSTLSKLTYTRTAMVEQQPDGNGDKDKRVTGLINAF
jgi:hypothetical protein